MTVSRSLALSACLPLLCLLAAQPPTAQNRASWMKTGRWGVMNHYLADWKATEYHIDMNVEEWNKLIDHFDVEALASQLASAGAAWYQISLGQNSGYYLAPNATYERLTGETAKCSRRDLVSDLYAALHKRNIRLMVYLPSGAPNHDDKAVSALHWRDGPYPNREFQILWESVIREWSNRWGEKVEGWWFDGCYFPNSMYRSPAAPNFASFAAAARAGNPRASLAFNPGVVYRLLSLTPDEDFTAGEIDKPDRISIRRTVDGLADGAQIHMLSFLGEKWGLGAPRFPAAEAIAFSRKLWDAGGAVTWDVPVGLDGKIAPAFVEQLTAIGKAASNR